MDDKEAIKSSIKSSYATLAKEMELKVESYSSPKTEKLLLYGYSKEELATLPESVIVMSDGCGNPTGLGMINAGDVVLDLGSGGGIDVLLASRKVGPTGRVIGLDMTEEMVERARKNGGHMGVSNVEFKLGEIEQIPLADNSVDVVISNCVICLSPEKEKVFREMSRVLRSGGRLAIADEIALRPFTEDEQSDAGKWCSCVTGAVTNAEYRAMLEKAGFENIDVRRLRPTMEAGPGVYSAFVSETKPFQR